MKKHLILELSGEWVLKHRNDSELPIHAIKHELLKTEALKVEITFDTLTTLSLDFDDGEIGEDALKRQILEFFSKKYPEDNANDILTLNFSVVAKNDEDKVDDGTRRTTYSQILKRLRAEVREAESGSKDNDFKESENNIEKAISDIRNLVGAAEFKALAEETVRIAPEIKKLKTFDVFTSQNYLLSIGDGCGLTTYLGHFAKLISTLGLVKISQINPVIEEKLEPVKDNMSPFECVIRHFDRIDKSSQHLLCVDISEWLNKTDSQYFRQFLRQVEKNNSRFIVFFKVPFVDKDVLDRLKFSLNDLLSVRTVSVPPFNRNELKKCALSEIESYGFKISDGAWEYFLIRINEEKSDGRFYGLNTVKKVVRELIYKKQLSNATKGRADLLITKNDARALCHSLQAVEMSGYEQLKKLVGSESVVSRVEEIVAQIELSLRDDGLEKPCIHMRFVGNPGTGKTTVAHIIGKLLKEKGVLRIGNFYEYSGRDFCGRYIGETAPKTASICRDAYGSVLFIDEAYSLYRGDNDTKDFGREAIDTLIAEMENHRNDLVVIMAGYTDEMDKLMKGNVGLASRMPYTIEFPNFTREQLYDIFASMVNAKFDCDDKLMEAARNYFMNLSDELLSSKEFSNARYVRNLFERAWAKAAMRCQLSNKTDIVITKDDFDRACADKEFAYIIPDKARIGF